MGYAELVDASDELLMQRYAGGDGGAFETLYNRHRGPLYRYMLRNLGDEMTANDLYQGVWERVIRARQRYRPTAKFTTWLYRIAHNHLVDFYRAKKPHLELGAVSLVDSGPEPDRTVASQQTGNRLHNAIAGLPPEQKDALLLKLEQGLSLEEIATVTGVGRETVKSRLRYATAKLRDLVEP